MKNIIELIDDICEGRAAAQEEIILHLRAAVYDAFSAGYNQPGIHNYENEQKARDEWFTIIYPDVPLMRD